MNQFEYSIRQQIVPLIRNKIDEFRDKNIPLSKINKYFKFQNNLNNLIKNIKYIGIHNFDNKFEYRKFVNNIINDVISDIKSMEQDKKTIKENMDIIKYDDFLNESFVIPNIKIDEFLHDISSAGDEYKVAAASFYGTFEQYCDITDAKRHILKVNDMKGDIMNNNRVIIKSMIFSENDFSIIKKNIVSFTLNEFYSDMPQMIDMFGIQVKPTSFIDKEQIRQIYETNITTDLVSKIVSSITSMNYQGVKNNFHIWDQK